MAAGLAILICDDLMDASRVTATARAGGFEMRQVRSATEAVKTAESSEVSCVVVDLQTCSHVEELIEQLAETSSSVRVVAYGPHVAAETLRKARQAGCDPVLPRSKFFEDLDQHLQTWLT